MPDLELLPGSYDLPGARLLDLVQVMDRIRRACPWTSQKTHRGLAKYAIEEAYELVEAIEDGDRDELREELGDVLLQVVFHARIAEEDAEEPFAIDDVAGGLVEKLIHRHPHVFGDETAETPEDVHAHWLRTKAIEKQRTSVTEGVPLGQPGLALAAKLASRVRTAGLDVPSRRETPPATPSATSCSPSPSPPRRTAPTRRRPCARRPGRTGTRSWRRRATRVSTVTPEVVRGVGDRRGR